MKNNNKGFSLIELIVVIAIMSIMVGFLVVSLSTVFGTKARECAEKVSAKIDSVKTGSVSLYNETMILQYHDDSEDGYSSDGFYTDCCVYTIDKNANSVAASEPEIRKVGAPNVGIKVYTSDGNSFDLDSSTGITISFDRSTGAFKPAMTHDGTGILDASNNPVYFEKITFSAGGRTYKIEMVPETGKHSVGRN